MTKKEFAEIIADRLRVPKQDAKEKVGIMFECIYDVLTSGEPLTINGFGSFNLEKIEARNSRNPKTGEMIVVPAQMKLKFKPCAQLKADIKAIEIE